ncbi:hypothetical protein E2562_018772, partial [Oryza meyeriana var. granulata]
MVTDRQSIIARRLSALSSRAGERRVFGGRGACYRGRSERSSISCGGHITRQSDSDPNFEETDESEDESNNEVVFDTLKSLGDTDMCIIKEEKEDTDKKFDSEETKAQGHISCLLRKNFLKGSSKLKDRTSFPNNKELTTLIPKILSPEPFELDGPEDISSMDFILVDYENPMEEIKSPVKNEISDPPTGDATESNLNENYPTMDNINTAEQMAPIPPTDSSLLEEHQCFDFNTTGTHDDEDSKCAKLATLVDYPESPKEIGDPNLDLALNNIIMTCTRKATEVLQQTSSSKTITSNQNSSQNDETQSIIDCTLETTSSYQPATHGMYHLVCGARRTVGAMRDEGIGR